MIHRLGYFPLLLLALLLTGCAFSGNQRVDQTTGEANQRLHDIWALKTLRGKPVSIQQGNQLQNLELNLTRMEALGSDGCNQLSASILTVGEETLTLGPIQRTKMMCARQGISDQFVSGLKETRTYALRDLNLFFYGDDGAELMMFLKVD